jgi:hypothetical protein
MKISEIITEQGPQAPVKPVASAVVKSPSAPAVPTDVPATTPKKMNVKQAQKEYNDIEDEETSNNIKMQGSNITKQGSNLTKQGSNLTKQDLTSK